MERMTRLVIDAQREGYTFDQVYGTMTVGELRRFLEDYDDDTEIFLSHDNDYTFGGIRMEHIQTREYEKNDDPEVDDEWVETERYSGY